MKLQEALRMSQNVPRPNIFISGLCCNLFETLAVRSAGRYGPLFSVLIGELGRSIFADYDDICADTIATLEDGGESASGSHTVAMR